MIRVFINGLPAGNRSGTGRYTAELLRALARLEAADARFIALIEADFPYRDELQASGVFEMIPQPRRPSATRVLWEAFALSGMAHHLKLDVFHAPAFIAPSRLPCPSVVTLHDCAFLRCGETIHLLRRLYYRRAIPRSARQAALVAIDSESTRRDAMELMGLPSAKLRVVPLGVGEDFFVREVPTPREVELRNRIDVERDFILTTGALEPRKNLETLIRAYARLRVLDSSVPPLVIAGRRAWRWKRLEALAQNLGVSDRVRFPGYVADADLPFLLALATVFVCVSRYEGFGLPPLEAMAAGTPALVSNASSLPEVVGGAGVMVEPDDIEAIARGLLSLLRDREKRAKLAEAGRRRAREYPWDRVARSMLELYREAAAGGQSSKFKVQG